jgi:hypothetical protein
MDRRKNARGASLSDTPRTDAMLVRRGLVGANTPFVEFVRRLERQNKYLIDAIDKIHDRSWPAGDPWAGSNHASQMAEIAAEVGSRYYDELRAAEGGGGRK